MIEKTIEVSSTELDDSKNVNSIACLPIDQTDSTGQSETLKYYPTSATINLAANNVV